MIESLNKDVLLDIFDYLDAFSLKRCAQVCKQWDSIIGSSVSTMRKLPLMLRNNWSQKSTEIQNLQRQFHTIILDTFTLQKPLLKIFDKIGSNVRHFELDEMTVSHRSFSKILSSMEMLEKIIISESRLDVKEIEATSLESLKSLVLISSDWQFLDYFTKSSTQVRELKIATKSYSESDHESFEDFLKIQTDLKELAIRVLSGEIYLSLAKVENKFKLKKLAVDYKYWDENPSVAEHFITFLKMHQTSLEELETQRNLGEKVTDFVMKELKLKRLIIDASQLPQSPLFYNAIRPNKHLKTLVVEGELNNFDVARGLLYIYPSIERLVVKSWKEEIINDVIVFIANNLKYLRYLEIPSLTADTPELAIPSLKTFHVDFVDNVVQWQTFLMNNPSVETIIVQWLTNQDLFTYEVLNAITLRLQNLQHVKFGAYFKPTQRILEMMSRNCPKLRLLEMFDNNPENLGRNSNVNLARIKVVYYPNQAVTAVFKVEPTMWKVEDHFAINSDLESDEDMSDEMMSWGDEDGFTDHESDFDYVDEDGDYDGIMYYF